MIVEFSLRDLKSLGVDREEQEILDALTMYGTPVDGVDGDRVRLEVFPNRTDMLSVEGIARALKGIFGIEDGMKVYLPKQPHVSVHVDPSVFGLRPFISCSVVRNVPMSEELLTSMLQLQEKLHTTHGRRRRKVAIGLHDLDLVTEQITYAALPKKEVRFVPLDATESQTAEHILAKHPKGVEFAHLVPGPNVPVLFDSERDVLSMPPIINSALTHLTPKTKNIFVDVTGTDELAVAQANVIVAAALADRGGAMEYVKVGDVLHPNLVPGNMEFQLGYCNKLLGLDLQMSEAVKLLKTMRFDVNNSEVEIPRYRTDIMHPIDLVEDVAIAYGYNNFEPELPSIATIASEDPLNERSQRLRELLVGFGFEEAFTFSLTNPEKLFTRMNTQERAVATIANPKSTDFTLVRDRLMPSLMEVLANNTHNPYPQKLFEVNDVVKLDREYETGARNERRCVAVLASPEANFAEAKALADFLIHGNTLKPSDHSAFIDGRQADVFVDGKKAGVFGEVHPTVLRNWGLEVPVVAFAFSLP